MNIRELIEYLKEFDENMEVWLSSDEEGNSYRNLWCVQETFASNNGFNKEVYADEDVEEMDEEDKTKLVKVVCCW